MPSSIRTAATLYAFGLLGAFLLVVPWTSIWERATLAFTPTLIGEWVRSGYVRGLVSAVGVLDLAVATVEARELWSQLVGGEPQQRPGRSES